MPSEGSQRADPPQARPPGSRWPSHNHLHAPQAPGSGLILPQQDPGLHCVKAQPRAWHSVGPSVALCVSAKFPGIEQLFLWCLSSLNPAAGLRRESSHGGQGGDMDELHVGRTDSGSWRGWGPGVQEVPAATVSPGSTLSLWSPPIGLPLLRHGFTEPAP